MNNPESFNVRAFRQTGYPAMAFDDNGVRRENRYPEETKWQRPLDYLHRLFPESDLGQLNEVFDGEACQALAQDLGIKLATKKANQPINYKGRIVMGTSEDGVSTGCMFEIKAETSRATDYVATLTYFPDDQPVISYITGLVKKGRLAGQEQMMAALENLRARLDANIRIRELEQTKSKAMGIIQNGLSGKDQPHWLLIGADLFGAEIRHSQGEPKLSFNSDKKTKARQEQVDVLCRQEQAEFTSGMNVARTMTNMAYNLEYNEHWAKEYYWEYLARPENIASLATFFKGNEQVLVLLIENYGIRYFEWLLKARQEVNPEQVFGKDPANVKKILDAGGEDLEYLRIIFGVAYFTMLEQIKAKPKKKKTWANSILDLMGDGGLIDLTEEELREIRRE